MMDIVRTLPLPPGMPTHSQTFSRGVFTSALCWRYFRLTDWKHPILRHFCHYIGIDEILYSRFCVATIWFTWPHSFMCSCNQCNQIIYCLFVTIQEYSFTPSAEAIELGSGETKEISFTARRIAYRFCSISISFRVLQSWTHASIESLIAFALYRSSVRDMHSSVGLICWWKLFSVCSVFGTVTSLLGKPEEGITLEARSESRGYYEETITDSEGKYRLRGLLPNAKYTIRAVLKVDKPGLHRIERSSPSSVPVQVAVSSWVPANVYQWNMYLHFIC